MKKLKDNAAASFIIVALVYILAAAFAIVLCRSMRFDFWLNLLIADISATAVVFLFSTLFSNASVYDPYWSVQPAVILIAYATMRGINAYGILLVICILLWSLRLTANWAYNFGNLNHEDWRYTMLAEKTGAFYPFINLIGIHLVPTLVVYAATLPAVYAVINRGKVNLLAVLCLLLCIAAVALQAVSDIQMQKYRKHRKTPFIRTGPWKHSRHPNYLGEILMWWGIGLSVICVFPSKWYLLSGAVLNTLLFIFVSIPMAEKRQSKKKGYEQYKNETRVLLPIKKFKKKV